MYDTVLAPADLAPHLGDPTWVLLDCRWDLADPARGARAHAAGHVPGARHADLDHDLSGPVVPGVTGRHPLPAPATLAATFGAWGIGDDSQVVAYDDAGGAFAARAWWLLHWLGHDAAAVLDGGLRAWRAAGLPLATASRLPRPRTFTPRVRPERVADAADVAAALAAGGRVLDARGADRFRGENETIDPVAGHVPGALSAPFAGNLTPEGNFRDPATLRARYLALVGAEGGARLPGQPAADVVVYCGSGVTAAHDVLAMRRAGLPEPRLYAGSWSHWITDPARPVATGDG